LETDPAVKEAADEAKKAAKDAGKTDQQAADAATAAAIAKQEEIEAKVRQDLVDAARAQAAAQGKEPADQVVAGQQAGKAFDNDPVVTLGSGVALATTAVTGLTDFAATFKDNPGRRLLSLYLGIAAGCLIAGPLGLDLFRAVLQNSTSVIVFQGSSLERTIYWGVALTGIIMGLGANPTHEAIKALQEYKKSRKSENVDRVAGAEDGGTPQIVPGMFLPSAPLPGNTVIAREAPLVLMPRLQRPR
jgi:hypothetical protein